MNSWGTQTVQLLDPMSEDKGQDGVVTGKLSYQFQRPVINDIIGTGGSTEGKARDPGWPAIIEMFQLVD